MGGVAGIFLGSNHCDLSIVGTDGLNAFEIGDCPRAVLADGQASEIVASFLVMGAIVLVGHMLTLNRKLLTIE